MESVVNKLFEYYDSILFEEKVEVNQQGYIGVHYDGLNLDYYLENSIYDKLSFVIHKATERDRSKRYTTIDEMMLDVNGSVREISEDVEEFVIRLLK